MTYAEVKEIIGPDPFAKTEEEQLKEYNSATYIPLLLFLGLDPRRSDGVEEKDEYKGAPVFALDVTPKLSVTEAAEKLIKELEEGKKYTFSKDRMHMFLPPLEGTSILPARSDRKTNPGPEQD